MRVQEIRAMIVRLRLRKEFKHASYTRNYSDNLLIRCTLADGTIGWGEGVPRSYVTGETPEGALEQLSATDLTDQLGADCESIEDVIAVCEGYSPRSLIADPRGCCTNAHRCAVELSLLDAFGNHFQQSLSQIAQYYPPASSVLQRSERVQYSSAISSGGFRKEMLSSLAMRFYGFRHCKVKVGMQSDHDPLRLKRMRRWVGGKMDLRVDANEAWSPTEVVRRIEALQGAKISCVEQPVLHADVACLSDVRRQIAVPIMLDESLTSMHDAELAIEHATCDLFNIRLSKCGGFLRSLTLAAVAQQAGLGYQLGCHPGESPVLSAAGRHFATSVGNISYREGSADHHLLKDQLSPVDITFGYGGWAKALTEPGLGIRLDEAVLQPMIQQSQTYRIS